MLRPVQSIAESPPPSTSPLDPLLDAVPLDPPLPDDEPPPSSFPLTAFSSRKTSRVPMIAPHPIVIAQSACSCISRRSFFGLRPAMSIPTSRIASTTSGQICRAGVEPADSARMSGGASCSKNACAICERPAL